MNAKAHPLSAPPAEQGHSTTDAWRKAQRPAFHPEEGDSDRSDWLSLFKAACLILAPVAVVAFLLSY